MSITEVENKIYREKMAEGCKEMKEYLEATDKELCQSRDKKRYRDKGRRRTVLKTKMGEVEYSRKVYLDNETSEWVYLLDKELGLKEYGNISPGVAELVATQAAESTYRETAREVSEMTGLRISHQTAWKLTQDVGEGLRSRPLPPGKEETKVLYEETDGVYLCVQGKARLGSEKGKREMKLGIAYAGIEQNGKRRKCSGKVAYGMIGSSEEFLENKEAEIASWYDVSKIEDRLYNGDGAGWIMGNSIVAGRWQLDTFHRNKAIIEYLNVPEMRKQVYLYLKDKDIDGCLEYIQACVNSSTTEEEYDARTKLLTYLTNNKEYLIPYTEADPEKLKLHSLNEGLTLARMGAMESNVFTMAANRMKRNRCCWSINGANNLVTIICLKNTNRLNPALKNIHLPKLHEEKVLMTSSKVPYTVGSGYDGYMRASITPVKKTIYNLCEE